MGGNNSDAIAAAVVIRVVVVVRPVALVTSAGRDAPLYHIPYPQSSSQLMNWPALRGAMHDRVCHLPSHPRPHQELHVAQHIFFHCTMQCWLQGYFVTGQKS